MVFVAINAVLWPLHVYSKRHPWNYFFMALFTICIAFAVGLSCALTKGIIAVPLLYYRVIFWVIAWVLICLCD